MAINPKKITVINKVSNAQFETLVNGGTVTKGADSLVADEGAIYLTPEVVDATPTENSTNTVTSGGVKAYVDNAVAVVYETYTIPSWTALSDSEPYAFSATVTATYAIGSDTVVELINDQAVLFANCGFAIGDVTGQNITIYAVAEPSESVSLTIGFRG